MSKEKLNSQAQKLKGLLAMCKAATGSGMRQEVGVEWQEWNGGRQELEGRRLE